MVWATEVPAAAIDIAVAGSETNAAAGSTGGGTVEVLHAVTHGGGW